MKKEDIVGRKIICFEFKTDKMLSFSSNHSARVGKEGTVEEIHDSQPDYSKVRFADGNYEYYPTKMIVERLEFEDRSVDDVIKELHGLFRKIYT
jgi:hypothetical protein